MNQNTIRPSIRVRGKQPNSVSSIITLIFFPTETEDLQNTPPKPLQSSRSHLFLGGSPLRTHTAATESGKPQCHIEHLGPMPLVQMWKLRKLRIFLEVDTTSVRAVPKVRSSSSASPSGPQGNDFSSHLVLGKSVPDPLPKCYAAPPHLFPNEMNMPRKPALSRRSRTIDLF